jgi:hypothetical protein
MTTKWILIFAIALVMFTQLPAQAGFPVDGKFKMQPASRDTWYYYDDVHWYIQAPDKWQHLMGSYASTKLLNAALKDRLTAATAVFLAGMLKELDDSYREGWSVKDVLMDAIGVGAAVCDTKKVRFIGRYTPNQLLLTVNFAM